MKNVIGTLQTEYKGFTIKSEICHATQHHPYDHPYIIFSKINNKWAHSMGFDPKGDPVKEASHIHNMVVGSVVAMVGIT